MRSKIISCVYHVNHTLLSLFIKKRNLQQNCYKYYGVMPRSSTHVLNMQLTREKLKKKSVKYLGNVNVSLQILGSGARGAPRCVYLTAGHISYIFNCGEGTQRLAYEHKYKLIKLEHIFVTSTSWNNLGGMPGMLLTIQEAGVPKIDVHGPKGTVELFDAVKKFVMLQALKIQEAKCDESEPYTDSVMSVSYVPITKSSVQEKESIDNIGEEKIDNINYYNYTINSNGKRVFDNRVEKEKKTQKVEEKSEKTRISSAMSYICRLHPRAGTLSLEKCVEKGVQPGPLFGQLKAGKDITLPDGTVVLSKDVCSPTTPGPVFLIVECPLEDYLESFVNHPAFVQHQATATMSNENDRPYCIIHFTPQRVIDDPRYIDWMNKFDSNTRHIVVNEDNECMGTEAIHRHQHKLHMLHSEIFPFLNEKSFQKKTRANDLPLIHRPRTNHTIHLQPEIKYDTMNEVSLHPEEYIKEVYEIEGFSEMLKDLQTNINIEKERLSIGKEYPKIIMLGTGSSIPSKVRNTSGILLRMDQNHSMLLDCGEGTFGQIAKIYGKYKMDKIIKTIKAVYISHPHADHHIGLIGFLKERKKITQDPLYLFAPTYIAMWLRLYHMRFEPILHQMTLIPNNEFFMDVHEPTEHKYKSMYKTLNVQAVKTTYVKHCAHSFGISVTLNNGKKIVYSGDTMPCENLVKLGQDCDLLIHEATMEDDLAKEAKMKLHSTTSQAIRAGEQMRSKFTLLTHFSQRYSVIPPLPNDDNGSKLNNVGIAYDNMHISLSQLPLLPLMYPTLKLMFIKHYMEVEERAARRRIAMNL